MTIRELVTTDPMMVRKFTPTKMVVFAGVIVVMEQFEVEDVGLADARLDYDEDVVDCSQRIFQITTAMMMAPDPTMALAVFPSRRWRNFREGQQITRYPDAEHPLLYIGNPVPLFKNTDGILVMRIPEFLIKSGMELGY